jgi:hypothetical protein
MIYVGVIIMFFILLLHRSCFYDDKNLLSNLDDKNFSICLDDKHFFYQGKQSNLNVQVGYPMKNQHLNDSNGLKKLRRQLKQQ